MASDNKEGESDNCADDCGKRDTTVLVRNEDEEEAALATEKRF